MHIFNISIFSSKCCYSRDVQVHARLFF